VSPNNPDLSYSNFDLRHRIVGTTSLGFNWSESNVTTLTLFYSGQSGSPYTFHLLHLAQVRLATRSNGNLAYIPKAGEQLNFADIKDANNRRE
jgi:hypothetical protein